MVWAGDSAAAIHAAFADPVTYTGAGLTNGGITAIFSDVDGAEFMGPGQSARHISFEIQKADLPGLPAKGDIIVHDSGSWKVIERSNHRDVDAWVLSVEKAS